ncbi:MAG TPA: hypothetical protein VK870_11525 [Ignavibacteriaceae bacterium]|nr:hypothetical protein [Ignavibacteriaceae bacterium]
MSALTKKLTNYGAVLLIGVLIFASNFLDTDIFIFGENHFAVWFVLSIMCFACGWFINRTLGWQYGGKVVFAVTIGVTFLSIFMITFFREYFASSELLFENIILYTLRNITLGAMGFFGMAIQQLLGEDREVVLLREKIKILEEIRYDRNKESELELKEAQLKAKEIILEAQSQSKNMILKKERIEKELKEFIQAEKELIKKYEEL